MKRSAVSRHPKYKRIVGYFICGLGMVWLLLGCSPQPNVPITPTATLITTFAVPISGLSPEQQLHFQVGNALFNTQWTATQWTANASIENQRAGLGILFNANSCASCHPKDGRGLPPQTGGASVGLVLRLSLPQKGLYYQPVAEPNYGLQLQEFAVDGGVAEGRIGLTYTEQPGTLADGTPYSLRLPIYQVQDPAYGALSPQTLLSPRLAPQIVGMGLLEAVPAETLLALADPTDVNDDGISGRPNWVWDVYQGQMSIGRFGWKANQPHVLQQVADAFQADMGIRSDLFPPNTCETQPACQAADSTPKPEISADDLLKVVLYTSAIGVPAQRDAQTNQVQDGARLFTTIGCSQCHQPSLQTGIHLTIPALSNQTIAAYSDLLLHDMGAGLADGRPDFQASGTEWRTAPLWGIGLFESVNGHTFYLHDGRARNLSEAILWHGGEATAAREWFRRLSLAERDALLAFLRSL
ncbi:MAG TPA: di-heme oxidoredictase family protein [Anaerolineales bacterium]|nr:di-heme oxidoredictase family protein [Anaerolineales bacterium]